jgi:hypothetical protein
MTRPERARKVTGRVSTASVRAWALSLPLAILVLAACMPPPQRMCTAATDCGGGASSCVAGRCIATGAVAAISTARRVVYEPVDFGYVRRGAPEASGAATFAALGLAGDPRVFLRFDVPLRADEDIVEAFLAIERAPDVAADPMAIVLHAATVVDRWEGRRLSWGGQPRIVELGLPETPVLPAGGARVRLDVRALLQRWRRGGSRELSVAVLSDGESATGVTFALAPGPVRGPELELYIR